jgi:hypothetical protein
MSRILPDEICSNRNTDARTPFVRYDLTAMTRRQRRYLSFAALIVLLLAVMPNALYMGHWPVFQHSSAESPPSAHAHHAGDDTAAAEEAHARAGHCPLGPAKCSDAQAPVQPFLAATDTFAMLAAGVLLLITISASYGLIEPVNSRIEKPPRRTALLPAT